MAVDDFHWLGGGRLSSTPVVSVIMPCRNSAQWLGLAIQSVQAQDFTNWELLLVDDASTDDSVSIVEGYARGDQRIRLFRLATSMGGAGARNHAIQQARGRYIAFLDADDLWRKEKLSIQLDLMTSRGLPFSYSAYEKTDADGCLQGRVYRPPLEVSYFSLLRSCAIGCSTVMLDSALLGQRLFPALKRSHDYALWLDILREGYPAHGIDMPLTIYRERSGSLSSNKVSKLHMAWHIYRQRERLGRLNSALLLLSYIYNGVKKRNI
ncbi:glycosyltransferase family 2 protein [Ferribacterium limneticum]|uniref:glycosyltransferase family 2 protein n=1 Tax=Ferribacterium limneticum TaxID=76259 RepID=UPI001CFB35D9|nr:glycosyltransferase family 2 protein [Ferribacterium limneticum]UCV18270.1 glycosyltransferase family 2 protein [Ferribacterium limneticum]